MRLAIFDLCDTLYAENTTVGFLKHAAKHEPAIAQAIGRWLGNPALFIVGAVAQRLGRDVARERLVASLAGLSRGRLKDLASAYAQELEARANKPITRRLEGHRQDGDRVIIVSSSLAPVVEAIAANLGVTGYGSTIGFTREGACTGQITEDLTGAKPRLVRRLREMETRLIVYSDNRTDETLLREADEGYAVLPAGRSRMRWAGDNVHYIEL